MYEDLKEKDIAVFEFIKEHSGSKGYPPSVREICKKVNIKSTSTVFSILNRLEKFDYIRKDPTKPRAIEILEKGVENEEVIGLNTELISLPVIGRIAAGLPILAEQNIEEYIPLPSSYVTGKKCFMLRVSGDSMVNVGIFDKDYIIIDSSQTTPPTGKIIAALVGGETATVKTFLKEDGKVILKPENPVYEPMKFDPNQVKILGVVTGLFRII